MKIRLRIILLLVLLLVAAAPAPAQTRLDDYYRQWVDYQNGQVSMAFVRTPIPFALRAIHAGTGLQIVIPQASETKVVNLRIDRQPLEPAVRSVIATIGYTNFALLYDESGRPSRAVVLGAQPAIAKGLEETVEKESSGRPLTAQEQETLQKELARWRELKEEERSRIEARLRDLPPSEEREKLMSEYGRQLLGLNK